MTKREREKIEREKLKNILNDNPKIKEIIDDMIDNPREDLKDKIAPIIQNQLRKYEQQGIIIGWMGFAIQAIEHIKDMNSVDEIKEYFKNEAEKAKNRLSIKGVNNG